MVVLTFEGLILPKTILIDSIIRKVKVYIPSVIQCMKCLRFGHRNQYEGVRKPAATAAIIAHVLKTKMAIHPVLAKERQFVSIANKTINPWIKVIAQNTLDRNELGKLWPMKT